MRKFLEPESVAVIGVPRQSGPGSYNNVEIMIKYGYSGRIYPINPHAGEICGLKAYETVSSLPEVPDLAIISVGRERVVKLVQACGDLGIKRLIVISQGFGDADKRGAELQEEILRIAAACGMRIMGPNTLGVLNNFCRFTTSFIDQPGPEKVPPVSIITQSGLFQVGVVGYSFENWGKAIDIGNASDIDHVDALQYLADDPETKVIVAHIEGIRRGREFLELAGRVCATKPVVVFKAGHSSAGAKAALSHTGSLVGEDEVADAAFRRAGIIRPRTMDDLKDAIHALLLLPEMKGPKVAVLTASGAGGIMAADAAEGRGLRLAEAPKDLLDRTAQLPEWLTVGNPVDYWPIVMIGGRFRETLSDLFLKVFRSSGVDGVLFIGPVTKSPLHADIDTMGVMADVRRQIKDKPLAIWSYIDKSGPACFEINENTAGFQTIERAVNGLAYAYQRYQSKNRRMPVQRTFAVDERMLTGLLAKARSEKMLLGNDALSLLAAFGIPVAKSVAAGNLKQLEGAADDMGYPVVLKVSGRDFIHKTEMGGVMTSLKNKAELRRAYRLLRSRAAEKAPHGKFDFIIQQQVTGREILIGLKKDPQFGPVIACGAGGIYTEVLRDIAREVAPIDGEVAEGMLTSLKIYPLLKGARGEAGVDLAGLCDILERISCLAARIPEILELDINPVMASTEGCLAVDARIIFG